MTDGASGVGRTRIVREHDPGRVLRKSYESHLSTVDTVVHRLDIVQAE